MLAAALVEAGAARSLLLVARSAPSAEEVEADLEALIPERSRVFPQRESVHPELDDPHIEISARRVDALQALLSNRARSGLLFTPLRQVRTLLRCSTHWRI